MCAFWSESDDTWLRYGIVLESYDVGNGSGTSTCWTYHLSDYTLAGADSTSGDWSFLNLPGVVNVLREVCFIGRTSPSTFAMRSVPPYRGKHL